MRGHISWQPIETAPQNSFDMVYVWTVSQFSTDDPDGHDERVAAMWYSDWQELPDGRYQKLQAARHFDGKWLNEFNTPLVGKPVAWFRVSAPDLLLEEV
jgi:hypothetical protein